MEFYEQLQQSLARSFEVFIQSVEEFFPNLLTALTLLITGLILAWLARWLLLRLGKGLDRMLQAIGNRFFRLRMKFPLVVVLGWVVYWLIMLFFLSVAVDSLGLPALADWLNRLFRYMPSLLVAVAFVVVGYYAGNLLRDRIREWGIGSGLTQAELLAGWARMMVILFAIVLGMTQIGIDVELFENILVILVTAFLGSMALAFGLGAAPSVGNIISARYLRHTYHVGQEIRINEMRGRILEITNTGVMLDTETGRTFIPARVFEDQASELLDNEGLDDD